MKDQDYQP